MIIRIESLSEAATAIGGVSFVVTSVYTVHWMVFLVPRLKRIFQPYTERLDAVSKVIEQKYPTEYEAAQESVARDRKLRTAI